MEKLSVAIITYNEEENIGLCIDSVSGIADEIIVLDSYSTDKTVEIATARGAIVRQQKFAGYVDQKNAALDLTTHPFVLCLDADEVLDATLKNSIAEQKKGFGGKAYLMSRCTNYCGKFIRHGSWYPDKKLRLIDKRIGRWGGMNIHEKIVVAEDIPIVHLKGDILHYSYRSVEDHVQQNNKFSSISASSLHQMGKKTSIAKILFHPAWAFLNSYLLRAGFLDGFYGLVIAFQIAQLSFLKHVKLYLLQNNR